MRAYASAAKATPAQGASYLVQRCSCGTPGHSGEMCEDCEKEKGGVAVQAKLIDHFSCRNLFASSHPNISL